ncbi:Detected protein of unknown function [Hibiscus syriacus]|uniref:Uncharacterized protein n=1 Tax=Hibiscus syriacus TaxID=106335 RepID=A0A6A3AT47_HIBSY|nr:uncharacterized protein LOC120123269 [Hibiscus syriacus]KAE8706547.1 Detected protein of unknown function [Hibiscus syriacus]
MMNQDNDQENNPDPSEDFLLKRKRGRPRKHPRHSLSRGEDAQTPWNQNPNYAENTGIPPGFQGLNGNRSHQANPVNDDVMVGQAVSGVIDSAFDAGYLLTVRVGDSDTTLRGVVFKPGHYVPVSAENDVVPNLQMIRRNEIPFPHERNGMAHQVNGPAVTNQVKRARASNIGALKRKHLQSEETQYVSPLLSRGTVVPVLLQPASLSNGKVASQQLSKPPHLAASKGKQVSGYSDTAEEKSVNPMLTVGNQIFPTQPQSSNHTVLKGIQSETVPYSQLPSEGLQDNDPKLMSGMPFEKLLTEVMKRVQVPPQPPEVQDGNLLVKDFRQQMEDDHPLSIEPLQAVQPAHLSSVLKPLENFRTGKMTELLKAVQENMRENQASRIEQPTIDSEETET